MSIPKPPAALSREQRREFRRIAIELANGGIDPGQRTALIVALIESEAHIAGLRNDMARSRGNARIQLTWALDRAIREKRKTHESLWRNAARRIYRPEPDPVPVLIADVAEHDPLMPDDRDREWWARKAEIATLPEAARDAAYAAAEAELGPESWRTLLDENETECLESRRVIRRNSRHGNSVWDEEC